MIDDPASYELNKQDEPQYYRQDEPQYYQQYDQQDGFARQNSGSFHGYAVDHDMRYDDEPLVSLICLNTSTCLNLAIRMKQF